MDGFGGWIVVVCVDVLWIECEVELVWLVWV